MQKNSGVRSLSQLYKITEQELGQFIWLGIRDDYRTLIGVNGLDIIEKKNEEQNEENSHV